MIPKDKHKRWALFATVLTALACTAFPNLSGIVNALGTAVQVGEKTTHASEAE